ncbi:unnamed protein product [Brugia timori]|nr:unnamed protein product [Brugia timori]
MRKICIPSESAMQTSTLSFEPVEAVADKAYRSRLPVRSGHASGSSMTASNTHEPRTSTCDEKISQSRIPVMASSIHRPHSHTQFTSQMVKPEVSTTCAMMASTNSRMITDL